MGSVQKLLELAGRVEAAAGADREIDAEIWRAVFPDDYARWEGQQRGLLNRNWDEARRQETLQARAESVVRRFTASLDAAMTLVPRDEISRRALNVTIERDDDTWGAVVWHPFDSRPDIGPQFTSPALALTAASLRALAAQEESRDAG